jgi:hypothetical protein
MLLLYYLKYTDGIVTPQIDKLSPSLNYKDQFYAQSYLNRRHSFHKMNKTLILINAIYGD